MLALGDCMGKMRPKFLRVIFVTFFIVVTCFAGLLWARPGNIACALIAQTSLEQWGKMRYSESKNPKDHERYQSLVQRARERIDRIYGESISEPIIVFFDSIKPIPLFKPNPYGSTSFVGNKACIFIGPQGQNVDVIAHEIVHTDILSILGTIDRTLHLPVWLDEGLAMQVDFRPEYSLMNPDIQDLKKVSSWKSARDFFDTSEEGELTNRYALAKSRVGIWVKKIGSDSVYKNLKSQVPSGLTHEVSDADLRKRGQ